MALQPVEKVEVIDILMKSLDQPDESIDYLWKQEVEERIDAYEKGKISALTVEEVIEKYKNR